MKGERSRSADHRLPSDACSLSGNARITVVSLMFFFNRVVEFASYSDLKNALEKLSGKEMNGRKIKLIEAAKKR